ncbi:MAG: sigma-70 family RNA polymerase sigma factor [Bacteroidetes bacterium]|nr:sigma-70 family RNA polymerase sigma factor [Bacteroidota bacterium]
MKATERNDDELILRIQSGEKHAYGELVRAYMQPAYYSALALVGSHDDALDLSQQAFIRAYGAIRRFERGCSFFTWYYRILRNLCLNRLRDRATQALPFSNCVDMQETASTADDPSVSTERSMLREQVRSALDRLRPEEREIVVLRDFEGYSYAEIAELLECPQGTVMSRLYYARKHLKDLLEDVL